MRTTRDASVLIGLLWCVALLSVVVISVLHTTWTDLVVVKNYGDRVQARYLAVAGIERAKALLYQDALTRSRSDANHSGTLYNAPGQFQQTALGRGHFRVFRRGRQDEGGGILYGVSDEESRLNANVASSNELAQIEGMTPDVASAILDWRGQGDTVSTNASQAEYYASLQPPSQPRNGPFETIRELLMVRGVTPELLLGADKHQNGFLPDAQETGELSSAGGHPGDVDAGWAGLLTVDSAIDNVSASGQDRVDIQNADEAALTGVSGITPEIARAIVAYRPQHRFQSIADLLDVTAPQSQDQSGSQQTSTGQNDSRQAGQPQQAPAGPTVISEELLTDIADELTASSDRTIPGPININTAGLDVLCCLPGVDRELAQAIISYRQSSGFFPNIAWLLKVPNLNHDIFKQIAPLVCTRSETYRIISEGRIDSTGVRQRVQVIAHVGLRDVTTLSYREDDL